MEQNPLRLFMKKRRRELGKMTQHEAAKLAGVNKATWNRWESEEQIPLEENLPLIARALDVKVEDLRKEIILQWQGALGETSLMYDLKGSAATAPLPGYEFRNEELKKMDELLDLDFSNIGNARLQLFLSDWRTTLRGQLINADLHIQSMRSSIGLYRRISKALLGLPLARFRKGGVVGRVRRKNSEKSPKDGPKRE
jgi:transcriptional regulator with XRE-family HTH domain